VTAASVPSTGELRRRALVALAEHGDERAVDALSHGDLAVAWSVARWDSSSGPVEGHRATLTLDAWRLGELGAHPAARDAICAALAAAVAEHPGQSLLELVTRWSPHARTGDAPYRDAPPSRVTLGEAVADYLDGAGNTRLARAVGRAGFERAGGGDVVVRGLPEEAVEGVYELVRAVRDLLGDAALRVRVERDEP
jgi:hypothetical protein